MTREVQNEASTFSVSGSIEGTASVPSTPTTLEYRIVDVTNERVVRDWTEIVPASTFSIDIVASDNAIYQDGHRPFQRFEERVVTVSANRGTDIQFNTEVRYLIKNLRGFDS